jgi:hypothetical protein
MKPCGGADGDVWSLVCGAKWSNVGPIALSLLDGIIRTLSTDVIVPFVNYYLSHGVNIPIIEGVQLVNPSIHCGQGYLAISTDISYTM